MNLQNFLRSLKQSFEKAGRISTGISLVSLLTAISCGSGDKGAGDTASIFSRYSLNVQANPQPQNGRYDTRTPATFLVGYKSPDNSLPALTIYGTKQSLISGPDSSLVYGKGIRFNWEDIEEGQAIFGLSSQYPKAVPISLFYPKTGRSFTDTLRFDGEPQIEIPPLATASDSTKFALGVMGDLARKGLQRGAESLERGLSEIDKEVKEKRERTGKDKPSKPRDQDDIPWYLRR